VVTVPVFASADTPAVFSADAVPYSAAPRRPSINTRLVSAFIITGLSLPAPANRASTSIRARGVVFGPSSPTIAGANGVLALTGGSPAAERVRLSASRDNRGASDTKKSLQEYASASAGVSGRLRSGCAQTNL
jgi:hypothetical protein